MRISDDRYFRDLTKLQLAKRMLDLEARTRTICIWTGMPRDRIRKLARAISVPDRSMPRARHRGRSPRQTRFFFRSPRIWAQASFLGACLTMIEVVPRPPDVIRAKEFPSVTRGDLLCVAYEYFCVAVSEPLIDFERTILLATELAQREELALGRCRDCGGVILVDLFADSAECAARRCEACRVGESVPSSAPGLAKPGMHEPVQIPLFDGIAQVSSTYGDGDAQTIVENCGNTLILRCSASEGGGTAKFASQLIGDREVIRREKSESTSSPSLFSKGGFHSTKGVSYRQMTEAAVMPSQIEQLPDLAGYFKRASNPAWLRVTLMPSTFSETSTRHLSCPTPNSMPVGEQGGSSESLGVPSRPGLSEKLKAAD